MRISDWSADVCSSDLGRVLTRTAKSALAPAARDAAVQVNVAERGPPLYCLLHCQPAGACTDAVAVIVLPTITSVGCAAAMVPLLARVNAYSARNALQIGRASCGERGCRYV